MFDISQKFLCRNLNQASVLPMVWATLLDLHIPLATIVLYVMYETTQAMLTFFNLQSPEPDLSQSHQNVGHCPKNFVINPLLFFLNRNFIKIPTQCVKSLKKSFSTTFSYFQSWNIHFSLLIVMSFHFPPISLWFLVPTRGWLIWGK